MNHIAPKLLAGSVLAAALTVGTAFAQMMAPPTISIASPTAGSTVAGTEIPVAVTLDHFKLACANMGKTNAPAGEGHVHVMVDGLDMAHLIGPYCSERFSIPGRALAPGKHVLTVALATDAHALASAPTSVPFIYAPASPNVAPSQANAGKPSLAIVSPASGAHVGKHFDLVVAVRNFDLSCDLEGKPNVAGFGHLHVMVQQQGETSAAPTTPMLAMMRTSEGMQMGRMLMQQTGMSKDQLMPMLSVAMPSMIGMPCTTTYPVDLSTWHDGPAKIVVQLANDDHMPTMGAAPAVVTVDVK